MKKSYGLKVYDPNQVLKVFNVLKADQPMGVPVEKTFYTVAKNQKGIIFELYENTSLEDSVDFDDESVKKIGDLKFELDGVKQNVAINMKFYLEESSIRISYSFYDNDFN
ncbi:MAG: hypothetical protein LUG46_03185, partial [Erysipelotrichaceae bacterium]|nr:hypothetical protein [Erysipelotrichaceae bacterium]